MERWEIRKNEKSVLVIEDAKPEIDADTGLVQFYDSTGIVAAFALNAGYILRRGDATETGFSDPRVTVL